MKKLVLIISVALFALGSLFAALDFTAVDETYDKDLDDNGVYETLKSMLSKASSNDEKAEVLWRLARICVDLGDSLDESDKSGRFKWYEEGEQYAKDSIAAKETAMGYLWKCSNIGRWGQTKGILDSLAKAKPMYEDVKYMVNTLKCLDSSEAWYLLAVLYDSLPGKPISYGDKDAAISYGRMACDTVKPNLMYLGTYQQLAEMLYSRNWSAKKRTSEIAKMQKSWDKETKSTIDKYMYYEGSKGSDITPVWSTSKLSEMSDREEAILILKYAINIYDTRSFRTASDDKNYKELTDLLKSWTK
ncbi:MAG: hypothetical protein HUK24_00640 [Sphaerochaetaceae bacterium]|nr:hypothetical protein [Sphaerochaetaceae bacterium]